MQRLHAIRAAVLVTALVTVFAATGRAETSSWVTRADPTEQPAIRKAPVAPPKRTQKAGRIGPQLKSDPLSTFGPRSSAPGAAPLDQAAEDAAYLAFDQGQYLTALDLAERRAARGDAAAHTLVARIYAEGLGVNKDEVTAARWYARGAELEDTEAAFALGVLLAEGRGVEKDRTAAGQMFEKAALRGHAYAHYNLALLFLHGDGKPENPFRAAQHLTFAAERGIAAAQ